MHNIVVVKGAGDIASGCIHKLHQSGFKVVALEISQPTAIRRGAAFSEAVYEKAKTLEGVKANLCQNLEDVLKCLEQSEVAVVVDATGEMINELKPDVVIDAILAKKNLNTVITQAHTVIALGPGFTSGIDCHAIIETNRGHHLGRVLYHGKAIENTGIPGIVAGYGNERILRAPVSGLFRSIVDIGDTVSRETLVGYVDEAPLTFGIDGLVRGLIRHNTYVHKGMKIGDIDPRQDELDNCYTISDKARSIAGGVLEAILCLNK